MAWRGLFLATAAAVAVLTVAAVAAEEPASQPAPAAAPVTGGASPTVPRSYSESIDWGVVEIGYAGKAMIVLTLAMLACFVLGLDKHRHDWKPLVLGLFALGMGLLCATVGMIDGCGVVASKGSGNLADFAQIFWWALWPVAAGLIAAMLGGLFTVILRWRNERFRKRQAEAAAETEAETEA